MPQSFEIDTGAVRDRLLHYLKTQRMTQQLFCEHAGIDPTAFNRFLVGKQKHLGTAAYFSIAKSMSMTCEELLYGEKALNIKGLTNEEKMLLRDFRMLDENDKQLVMKITQRLKEANVFAREL